MPKNKSFFILSFLSFVLLTGLLVFFSQKSFAQIITISPTSTITLTPTPTITFTLPPETTTPLPTSNLSSWCQKSYCGGCAKSECQSNDILDIGMPINQVCEWRDNFCYTQMMSSDKIPQLSKLKESLLREGAALYNSDYTQFFWNSNYGAISYPLPFIKRTTNIYEMALPQYICTGPLVREEVPCPVYEKYPAEPLIKNDSLPNTPEWANIFKPLISLFKKSFQQTISAEKTAGVLGEKALARKLLTEEECYAEGCEWSSVSQQCFCPSICYQIKSNCGYKYPWFVKDAETYTLSADEPFDKDECQICKHLTNGIRQNISTAVFKSVYTGRTGSGGGSETKTPPPQMYLKDVLKKVAGDFKEILTNNQKIALFGEKTSAAISYSNENECLANGCDWIAETIFTGQCVCPSVPPTPTPSEEQYCNLAGYENSVYSQLTGIPTAYTLPSAGVYLKAIIEGGFFRYKIWNGQIRYWAQQTLLKLFNVDKTIIQPGEAIQITWEVVNPVLSSEGYPEVYIYPDIDESGKVIASSTDAFYAGKKIGDQGSLTVYPQQTTYFYLIAKGLSGEGVISLASDPIEVYVVKNMVDLQVKKTTDSDYTNGPITITAGESIDLKWDGLNLKSCTASASPANSLWQGDVATSSSKTINGLAQTTTFSILCQANDGQEVSDSVLVNVSGEFKGMIQVRVRLDGEEWSGPINYALSGPQAITGTAPQDFQVVVNSGEGDFYTLIYISGGPTVPFVGIHPSTTQKVTIDGTTIFYLDFETQHLCTINVKGFYQNADWSGNTSYVLIGPTVLTGNAVPYSFVHIPPGIYYISYISGGPAVFSSVPEGNSQTCYPDSSVNFTLRFAEAGEVPPVVLPTPEIGNNPPTAKIGCAADDAVNCTGTIDGDINTPTITLYNASIDPDRDIRSCQWTIYNAIGQAIKSQNTCQPLTFDDEIGSYRATLNVVDSRGNSDSTSLVFVVKDVIELIAKFVWDPQIATVGKPINFYDRSLTPKNTSLKSWSWVFEDASPATSTSPNPSGVIFTSAGPKNVTLTVTNSQNSTKVYTQVIDVRSIAPQWKEVLPR